VIPDQFGPHVEAVARRFWGDPNPRLSSKTELRFGAHGARSVDLDKGVWFDNESGEGGGVLALVTRETGRKNGEAVQYLRQDMGLEIEDDRAPLAVVKTVPRKVVATYDYIDEVGEVLFQVVRLEPKDFRQRRPDSSAPDGWSWSVKGVRQVPYRLPEVIEAISTGAPIFIVEGEKDADALWAMHVPATCNAGGAGKWPASLSEHFAGANVVLLPDNDDAGRNHAAVVGASLIETAASVRTLRIPGLPPKGDVSDWVKTGGEPADLYALTSTMARPWAAEAPVSKFGAVQWADLDSVAVRQDWLVEDILFWGDFCLSYGISQSGKSFLSLDMGLAIARGSPFLGKPTRRGGVIYQAGEGGKGLVKRLKAYRKFHDLAGEDLPFVLLPDRVDLFAGDADNGVDAFITEVMALKAWLTVPLALVVIDTWATATPGANENASEDVSRALRSIQRIQDATGAAVLVVHHKNAGGEKPRGHTSLYANADSALEVIRDEDRPTERTVKIAKVKDGEDGQIIGFVLQFLEIGAYDSGKPMTSCVVVPAEVGDPGTGDRSRQRLPRGQYKFLKILDDAILQRGGVLPPEEGIPFNMMGVEWGQFRTLYVTVSGYGLADDAIRQALKRDGDSLFNRGLINKHEHWIWITDQGRRSL
jgi:hypothetical protein